MSGIRIFAMACAVCGALFPASASAQKYSVPEKRNLGAPSLVYEPPALTYERPQTAYKPPVIRQPVTRQDCSSANTTRRCVKDAPKNPNGR